MYVGVYLCKMLKGTNVGTCIPAYLRSMMYVKSPKRYTYIYNMSICLLPNCRSQVHVSYLHVGKGESTIQLQPCIKYLALHNRTATLLTPPVYLHALSSMCFYLLYIFHPSIRVLQEIEVSRANSST